MHILFRASKSAPQLWVVKHEKLKHVLDTIFWDFWAESVHRATMKQEMLILGLCCHLLNSLLKTMSYSRKRQQQQQWILYY